MNHSNRNSIDGFTLRRRNTTAGNSSTKLDADTLPVPQQYLAPRRQNQEENNQEEQIQTHAIDQRPTSSTVGQAGMTAGTGSRLADEINDSLRQIDDEKPQQPKRRFRVSKKGVKRAVLIILALVVIVGGYLGVKTLLAGGSVFKGNLFDVFTNKSLKKDEFGRSNILLFGTSEDDPAHIEEGSGVDLTDSMMILSIDQEKKNAVMFSVPRDLWIDYGESCFSGYSGKINAYYSCAKDGTSEQDGANKLKSKVGDIFGLDVQYYAKVNYSALKDAVNAVGGITVTIDSDNPNGIYDPNFDWQCNFRCKMVKWPNGPAQLDGDHALALARARDATGRGYGLEGGNFSREQYQQKIILAIKEKAASAGTLTNPVAVSGLIDSIGNNVKTNFETSEIKTLVDLASSINKTNIRSINLVDKDKPLVTTGSYSGQSIVRPVAGITDFSKIRSYISEQLSGSVSTSENATVEVLNGTDRSGVASKKEAELEEAGISVTSIGDAPTSSSYGAIKWFDMTGGSKPQMAKKIQEALGEASSGSTLPSGVQSDADFVIIVGT